MRPPGSPTPQEAAAVPCDTPLCSVTLWDLEGKETLHKINRHAKMREIFTDHANRRSTTPDSLRFLHVGQRIYTDKMPSSLYPNGSSEIDCGSAKGESATPWLVNLEGNS